MHSFIIESILLYGNFLFIFIFYKNFILYFSPIGWLLEEQNYTIIFYSLSILGYHFSPNTYLLNDKWLNYLFDDGLSK